MDINFSTSQPQFGVSRASAGIGLRLIVRVIGLAQAVALTACAAAPSTSLVLPSAGQAPVAAPSAQALAALRGAVGEAPCSSDSQCHSVAIGARPCGGPEGYSSWSEQTADAKQIAGLAASYAAARKAENARSGIASDCRFIPDPGAVCRARVADGLRTCQPGTAGRGGAV